MSDKQKMWKKVHGYTNGYQILIVGNPVEMPEGDPLYHSCDAMGCSSLEHYVTKVPVMFPEPYLMPLPDPPEVEDK